MMRFSLWICYILVAFIYVKCQDEGCICDSEGTLNYSNCSNETLCECVEGYSGQFCHQCDEGFFRLRDSSSSPCQSCGCHVNGADNKTCDSYGTCYCRDNVIGAKCDECADGFFNLTKTCQECQCNGKTQMCNKTSGICINCQDSTTGDHCETCLPGYYRANDLCKPCNDSSRSSLCIGTTIEPVTSEAIPMSHDTNSSFTQITDTNRKSETTTDFNISFLQPTSSSPTNGTVYPNNTVSARVPMRNSSSNTPHPRSVATSAEPLTNHSRYTGPPTTGSSSKGSLAVVLGVVLTLIILLVIAVVLLVYYCWVKPRRRFFRSPLWTIELRRDEDDTLFNDLQTIDPDVLYLDDAYLMDSARVYNKVTTENSRYHPLG